MAKPTTDNSEASGVSAPAPETPPALPVPEQVAGAVRLEGEKIKTNLMNMPIASMVLVGLAGIGLLSILSTLSGSSRKS